MPDQDEDLNRRWPLQAQVGELWGSHKALEKQFRAHELWDEKKFDEIRTVLKEQDIKADRMEDKTNSILQTLERMAGGKAAWSLIGNRALVIVITVITTCVGIGVAVLNHIISHW